MPELNQSQAQPRATYLELLKDCLTASIYDESSWRVHEGDSFIRRFVIKHLAKRNRVLVKVQPFDPVQRQDGADWPLFGYTMIGRKRLDNVEFGVRDVVGRGVPGDLVETGSWRGGCCIFMRALLRELGDPRTIWVCDSFEDLPVPKDEHEG